MSEKNGSEGTKIIKTQDENGDVYNWSYKNSSFSFNSASYYVIIRAIR